MLSMCRSSDQAGLDQVDLMEHPVKSSRSAGGCRPSKLATGIGK